MARLVSWTIIALAVLGVASLASLPLLAGEAAEHVDFARPEALPPKPQIPDRRENSLVPVSELHETLRLPKVDTSLTDEHSRASLAAYRAEDYERAFEETVLALDPTPLGENELYRTLTTLNRESLSETAKKPNGRPAIRSIDEALQPIVESGDPKLAHRLNNAAAMFILRLRNMDPTTFPQDPSMAYAAEELAYQAADVQPSYCPALLNLTLFNAMMNPLPRGPRDPPGYSLRGGGSDAWTEYYPPEGCKDPALLYYRAQNSISRIDPWPRAGALSEEDLAKTLELTDELLRDPELAGLAHAVRGDAYYWYGTYNLDLSINPPRPFTAQRYFELALQEYDSALALQPDDTAIRNGKALVYLELGEANNAVREAEAALEAAPDSYWIRRTLIDAYEAKKDYAVAAQLTRDTLSSRSPTAQPSPLALVPYSPISHGADAYSQLRVPPPEVGGAGAALFDEDVIKPFNERSYISSAWNLYAPGGIDQNSTERLHYDLLRYEFLSGDLGALNDDLRSIPEPVLQNNATLLLIVTHQLLNPQASPTTPEVQEALDTYLAYSYDYQEAGNFFRQHAQYEKAIRVYSIWRSVLERARADGKSQAEAENLLGEAYFLNGQDEKALAAFERAQALYQETYPSEGREGEHPTVWPPYLVREAFMHEQLGDYDRAAELYRQALGAILQPRGATDVYGASASYSNEDYYHAAKHLGDMLLRQARNFEAAQGEGENVDDVRARYQEAAGAYREALTRSYDSAPIQTASAANNLGIALIKMREYEEAIEVLKTLVESSADPPAAWKTTPVPDENNPIFRLNLGWAYELNDQPEKAKEQYLAAVTGDPSFHPALNDLGVMAAKAGDVEEAKGYFNAALDQKPDYDYAAYNLGVALLRSDTKNVLAGQHYLARAVGQNPSLAESSYDYVFDNQLYFIDLSLGERVPPNWEFAKDARNGMGVTSLLVLVLLFGRIALRYVGSKFRETFIQGSFSRMGRFGSTVRLPRLLARLRDGVLKFMSLGVPSSGGWWMTLLSLLISVPAIVVVMGWSLLRGNSEAELIMLMTLSYLVLVTLLVHHTGHVVVASWFRMRVWEAPWLSGIVQTLLLVAVGGPALAPMPANVVEGTKTKGRDRERSLIYVAGPAANMLLALLLFILYLISHIPLLRLGAILNLAAAAVSLLLLPPLDGAMVGKGYYARLLFWVGLALAAASLVVYFSNELFCQQSPGASCWGLSL